MSANSDRLVMIGVAHDEIEASVWRDALEREGVAVYVKSADPLSSFGVAPLPGSLQLFVLARDEKRARWILGDLPGDRQT
ncbi:MAG: hypothetical protein HYY03_05440 [Chloroflexi bacterium]|nr:hypothetical protein [Chloroflexota bacterium]